MPFLKAINYKQETRNKKLKSNGFQFPVSSFKFGFTLIEILIAISILAILTGVGSVAFNNALDKGRDSKRKQDVASIKGALALYFQDNGYYPCNVTPPAACTKTVFASNEGTDPNTNNWIPNLIPAYIKKLPKDPRQALSIFSPLAKIFEKINLKSPKDAYAVGPTCTFDSPTNGATVSGVQAIKTTPGGMDGNATSANLMEIKIDETAVNTVIWADGPVAKPGNWPWNTTSYTNGSHSISCRVTDTTAGTESTTTISVNVNNTASQVTRILRPSANGDFNEWDPQNCTPHWQCVNQPETYSNYGYMAPPLLADDNALFGAGIQREYFHLPDGQVPVSATNISVTLWGEASMTCAGANCPGSVKFVTKIGFSEQPLDAFGFEKQQITAGRYASASFLTDPSGGPWDPSDIDNLQIGLKDVIFNTMNLGKFFAVVTYSPGVPPTPPPPTPPPPTPPPPTPPPVPGGCTGKVGVYCYIVTSERQNYTLWAQLENKKDPEIYNPATSTCLPPPDLNYNYCLHPD